MKKSVFILTAALSFGVAAAQQVATPAMPAAAQVPTLTDVPAGHWAKDAIDRLVARGVLLGYPDGTFRGTQNLTRYEAAIIIARLLNQMGNGQGAGLDAETATSLQNAVQELSADLAALGVRVNDLEQNAVSKEDFTRLEDRVEALDGGSDLKGLAGRYDELSANYETLRADVDDNASSIAALNDLTVLLNQDILNLQDRASALEAAQADFVTRTDFDALSTSVKSIDGRVTTLENAPKFTIGGTLEATYGAFQRTAGTTDFDIDRLTTGTPIADYLSSDTFCKASFNDAFTIVRDYNTKYRCADTSNSFTGIKAQVKFGVSNIKTANGAIIINSASATLRMLNGASMPTTVVTDAAGKVTATNSETFLTLENAQASGATKSGVKFAIRYDGGFSNSGNGSNSSFKFNDYLLNNDNDTANVIYRRGVVATVDASSAVPALAPQFTVLAGVASPRLFSKDGVSWYYPLVETSITKDDKIYYSPVAPLTGGYFGVRVATKPSFGTLALNYVQGNIIPNSPNVRRDAAGIDADFKVGPVAVQGAFVGSYSHVNDKTAFSFNKVDKAGYAKFGVDISGIKVNANYRYIDAAYESGVAGMSANDADFYIGAGGYKSSMPFGPNENGYGVNAKFSVGPVAVGAYVDSFVAITPDSGQSAYVGNARQTAYGVQAGTSAIKGFSLTGYYNNATVGTVRVTELFGNNTVWNNFDGFDSNEDFTYANGSNFGVKLAHDGKAADALVKGLDINLNFAKLYDDNQNAKNYGYTDIVAAAKYDGKVGFLKVTPFVRYHSFQNANSQLAVSNSYGDYRDGSLSNYEGSSEVPSYSAVKFGVQVATDPLDIVTKPSLFAGVSDRVAISNTASELFANGGITFNEFIVPEAKLSVGYSYYQGSGISDNGVVGRRNAAFSITNDSIFANPGTGWTAVRSSGNAKLDGYYAQLEAYGVRAAYGVFRYNNLNDATKNSTAQAFKVSTKINF